MKTILKRIGTSILTASLLIAGLTISVQAAENNENKKGSFTAVAMNVDGLPQKIAGVTLNGDGPGSDGTKLISQKLATYDWDFIGVSEDFNYNNELLSALKENYNSGTHRGKVSWITNDTDGLNLLWKKAISVTGEKWTSWNTHFSSGVFNTGNGADGMIDKGYRYYALTVAEDVTIDVYILHMDADSDAEDIAARESQLSQLADAIKSSDNKNPIIVMGDTNCRYTREHLQEIFINGINEDPRFTVQDCWIEKCLDGQYPTYGSASLMVGDLGYVKGEIVDKMFYINNADSDVTLTANNFRVATDFTKEDGTALADHFPIVTEFGYTVKEAVHEHNYQITDIEQPTCTEQGYSVYTCIGCEDSYQADFVGAKGHDYVEGTCIVCGETDPDYVPDYVPDDKYYWGEEITDIIDGEYIIAFHAKTAKYTLTHNENATVGQGRLDGVMGFEVDKDCVWNIAKQENGYTISTEIDGTTKYLGKTTSFVGAGYKTTLQEEPFVWLKTTNGNKTGMRFYYKNSSGTGYYLRYTNASMGWIVSNYPTGVHVYRVTN